jgi:hypothetical protein
MSEDMTQVFWSSVNDQLATESFELDPGARDELERVLESAVSTLDREGAISDPDAVNLAERRLRLLVDAATNEARLAGHDTIGQGDVSDALDVIPLGFWPFT